MTNEPSVVPVSAVARVRLLTRLLRRPVTAASLVVLVLIAIIAAFAPVLAPLDPAAGTLASVLAPPGPGHLLGGDSSGRDVFSRMLVATQVTLLAALLAVLTAAVVGVGTGLIAGYFRGWFDALASWVTALVMALPGIVVLLAARSVLGPSVWLSMLIFGLLLAPSYYRLVHASVTAVREELYVDAARVAGLSNSRIIGRHVLSAVRAPIVIQSSIVAGVAIAVQSGLEFLGLGDLAVPTWGSLLNDGFANIYRQPLLLVWPSIAIVVTCLALALLANGMRDILERSGGVRRRRHRATAAHTGSVAAVTTSVQVGAGDGSENEWVAASEAIIHSDDEHSVASNSTVLSIRDLRVAYDQEDSPAVEVVHGVSLDIRPGEVHGLVGESGSGKSQTAFAALGLLSKGGRVTGGTILFAGERIRTERDAATLRGKRIGYIPQEPMTNLDPSFTIGSQLIEPLRKHLGLSKSAARSRAIELLDRVGIADPARTLTSYPFEVSGGMAQRVLIAGAVSTGPDLIVADEPTTALDVTVQAEVLDLLRDIQRENGTAMLLVTHNLGVVADLCDRVTVMQRGHFVEQGPVRTILRTPAHAYTRSLLGATLDDGPSRSQLVQQT